jgi:hypothetical protein
VSTSRKAVTADSRHSVSRIARALLTPRSPLSLYHITLVSNYDDSLAAVAWLASRLSRLLESRACSSSLPSDAQASCGSRSSIIIAITRGGRAQHVGQAEWTRSATVSCAIPPIIPPNRSRQARKSRCAVNERPIRRNTNRGTRIFARRTIDHGTPAEMKVLPTAGEKGET